MDSFNEDVNEYREWINKEFSLNQDEAEDLYYIITLRDEINEAILSPGMDKYLSELALLDIQWLSFIHTNHDPQYRYKLDRNNIPDKKWWWYIDHPDVLERTLKALKSKNT